MSEPLLQVEHLAKRFGGIVATDDLALDVAAGELHAVIGPNGAGKTTLIAQLSGQLTPDSGRIRFAGNDITALPMYRRSRLGLARSFQITSLFLDLSVLGRCRASGTAPGADARVGVRARSTGCSRATMWSRTTAGTCGRPSSAQCAHHGDFFRYWRVRVRHLDPYPRPAAVGRACSGQYGGSPRRGVTNSEHTGCRHGSLGRQGITPRSPGGIGGSLLSAGNHPAGSSRPAASSGGGSEVSLLPGRLKPNHVASKRTS